MTVKTIMLGIALISLLTLAGCKKKQNSKNVCPIDGQPPQWSGGRKGSSCEYFHYSDVEKRSHSWWADCALDQTQQASPPPGSPH